MAHDGVALVRVSVGDDDRVDDVVERDRTGDVEGSRAGRSGLAKHLAHARRYEVTQQPTHRAPFDGRVRLRGLNERVARTWITNLTDPKNKKTSSEEQLACIQKIVDR